MNRKTRTYSAVDDTSASLNAGSERAFSFQLCALTLLSNYATRPNVTALANDSNSARLQEPSATGDIHRFDNQRT